MSFNRRIYDLDRFNLPRSEFDEAMGHIRQAIDGRPDGKKPFIILYGAPGVGKSWLLARIRHELSSQGVRCSETIQAQTLLGDRNAQKKTLIRLLTFCLETDWEHADSTLEETLQELSNLLDLDLRNKEKPLALFFDDLDHWHAWEEDDLKDVHQKLWWALLRHTHMPGLVICTSREPRPMPRSYPALIRKLQLIEVAGLEDGLDKRIDKLVDGILQEKPKEPGQSPPQEDDSALNRLRRLAHTYSCGHPLVVDWLVSKFVAGEISSESDNLAPTLRDELADVIIGQRVDPADQAFLIDLARNYPDGFANDDPALRPQGLAQVQRLVPKGLVDWDSKERTYRVLPPLVRLYTMEVPHD